MSNPKKPSVELKIDTGLEGPSDEPVLETFNDDTGGMDVDGDADEGNEDVEDEEAED